MARFRTEGLDDIIDDMTAMGQSTGELADEMLFAGAEEVKKAWKAAIRRNKLMKNRLIDKSDMLNSVNYSRTVKRIGDIKSVDIYPQGKDRKGVKNAEKAFINHYGTSEIDATYFVDDADDIAGPLVENRLRGIFYNWLKKHKMG